MESEVKVYHWTEVHPNNVKVDSRMLLNNHVVVRNCYLVGMNAHNSIPEKRIVKYDKEYVIHRISQSLKPLSSLTHDNFHQLIDEAYMSMQEEE